MAVPVLAQSSNIEIQEDTPSSDRYYVGYKKMIVESNNTGDTFQMAIVYPTNSESKPVKFGPFKMRLAIAAEIAKGKFPVVIISHGSGGSNIGHRSIAFSLVKKGFIVAMPLHPGNNYKNNIDEDTVKNWMNRPQHIKSAIDHLFSNNNFSQHIDKDKVAVIGHSVGGYTALALAGGVGNTQYIINFCHSNSDSLPDFCWSIKNNSIQALELTGLSDSRVKALVLMAPLGLLFQGEQSLSDVKIPVLLYKAEKDAVLAEPYNSDLIANKLKRHGNLTYKSIPNAGHFSFITPLPNAIKNQSGIVAEDPEGFYRMRFHQKLSKDITAYLTNILFKK